MCARQKMLYILAMSFAIVLRAGAVAETESQNNKSSSEDSAKVVPINTVPIPIKTLPEEDTIDTYKGGKGGFDAEVQDLWISPSDVVAGDKGDVYAKIKNLSDYNSGYQGRATFDIRIIVWPPVGSGYYVYWDNYELTYHQTLYFYWPNYSFDSEGQYTVKAEVYDINGRQNNWNTSHRFDYRREYFDIPPAGTSSPDPDIRDISYDHSINLDEWAEIEVKVKNKGDDSDEGGITISFPSFTSSSDDKYTKKVSSSSDITYVERPHGKTIHDRNGNSMSADYLLVEGYDTDWKSNETNKLVIKVKPQEAGDFIFQVRSAMHQKGGAPDDWVNDPSSGSKDQQGWSVKKKTITVNSQPPSPDLFNVDISSNEIMLGDEVTIKIEGRNNGGDADEGDLTIEFPDLPDKDANSDHVRIINEDTDHSKLVWPSDPIYGYYNGTPISGGADYTEAVAYNTPWSSTEGNEYLEVGVKPTEVGQFRIFTKMTIGSGNQWYGDPSSGIKDQHYEYVDQYIVNVTLPSYYKISGYVKTPVGMPVEGVTMTLTGHSPTTTNPDGYYEFTDLEGGYNYTVTPSKPNWVFDPQDIDYASLNSDQTNENYTATPTDHPYIAEVQLNRKPAVIPLTPSSTDPFLFEEEELWLSDRGHLNIWTKIINPTSEQSWIKVDEENGLEQREVISYREKLNANDEDFYVNDIYLPATYIGNHEETIYLYQCSGGWPLPCDRVDSVIIQYEVEGNYELTCEPPLLVEDHLGKECVPQWYTQTEGILSIINTIVDALGTAIDPGISGIISLSFDIYRFVDYTERQSIVHSGKIRSFESHINGANRELKCEWDAYSNFQFFPHNFGFDRAIVTATLPPEIDLEDVELLDTLSLKGERNDTVSIVWFLNAPAGRIQVHNRETWAWLPHSVGFRFNENGLPEKYKVIWTLNLDIGPFLGHELKINPLDEASFLYTYNKWRVSPNEVTWYLISLSKKTQPIEKGIESKGTSPYVVEKDENYGFTFRNGTVLSIPSHTFSQNIETTWYTEAIGPSFPDTLTPISEACYLEFAVDSSNTPMTFTTPCSLQNTAIFHWNSADSGWKYIPTGVDSIKEVLVAKVKHSGYYRAFQSSSAPGISQIQLLTPLRHVHTENHFPLFSWEDPDSTNKWEYRLQISSKDNFSSQIYDVLLPSCEFEPQEALSDTTYYWRIRRIASGAEMPWAEPWMFTIIEDSTSPSIAFIHPQDGDTASPLPEIKINVADSGTGINFSQTILVSDADTLYCWQLSYDKTKEEIQYTPEDSLPMGNHKVVITVIDNVGNTASDSIRFTVGSAGIETVEKIPRVFALYQNFPNPFSYSTTIKYAVPERTHVSLKIYDAAGRLASTIVNREVNPGRYEIKWLGKDDRGKRLASGAYFLRFHAGNFKQTMKMIITPPTYRGGPIIETIETLVDTTKDSLNVHQKKKESE